jgi:hypothetical protein
MLMHGTLAAGLLLSCAAFAETGPAAFANLHRLVGEWEARTASGSVIRLSYRAIAAGSALVETFRTASGRETLTIYHADGPDLIATHYCAQGNQPRLRLDPASTRTALQFAFSDATNLAGPGASRLTRLRFLLRDAGHFDKTEVYTQGGKDEVTVFNFVRVSPGQR